MSDFKDKNDVLACLQEHKDIQFVNIFFPDILGELRGFSIPAKEVEDAFENGKGFDGSSIEGLVRIEESDLVAFPDPTTFHIFPWEPAAGASWKEAFMFCDVCNPERTPHEGDSRGVLKRNLNSAAKMGFPVVNVGPELEFYFFKSPQPNDDTPYEANGKKVWVPECLDHGGYFSQEINDPFAFLRKKIMLALEYVGIQAEYDHHEVGPSTHEIDLRYMNALEMADTVMIHRMIVKRIAKDAGIYATFMPKPLDNENGSGMHIHISLQDECGRNAFFNEHDKYHLSDIGKHFLEGLLVHINEITAITNPWVNSYKRLIPGFEAPVYHVWGQRNRSALIRVPEYQPGKENARRIELRSPDPSCNPYLAFSVILVAGLQGINNKDLLRPPYEGNVYQAQEKLDCLPATPKEALDIMKAGSISKKALGEHVFQQFIRNMEREIESYTKATYRKYDKNVSPWELQHLLPRL